MARVLLFASAREAAGRSRESIEGATVAEVLSVATRRFGPRFEALLGSCTVWLNGEKCTPDAVVADDDEVAVLPPVSGGASDPQSLSLDDLRAQRDALQREEDAVSFVRRLAQGRLDIAREEQRRRAAGEPAPTDVTGGIARVFAQEHGAGSNRPPRDTQPPDDHALLRELEALCVEVGFGEVRELDDAELASCCQRVAEFESRVSTRRKQLFADIDVFSKELVRRYRTSTSSVDALLDQR
ncbi:MAG: MoaD/ThiS family protein [Actinobacteria bacterium]|nr:MoaD/ThiS family protein [Actinomycetota bacterium]NBY58556.1 MoaD/ThiS family protein [Actinomycetota bacterium]NDE66964.1 MoaD/ThiS family protein [Actinomycetota bacterium]